MIRNLPSLIKGSPRTQQARRLALNLLDAALTAVDPHILVPKALRIENKALHFSNTQLRLDEFDGIYVVGAGKASGRMAEAIETLLHDHISDGVIIVPDSTVKDFSLNFVRIHPGGHPLPTNASILATQQLLDFIAHVPQDALVISAFSGGGSALLTLPAPTISLTDLQKMTHLLLHSGATIRETNTIRKHLSQVKGGQLARHIHPRHHLGLLLSDVPGDQLDVIASGPTLPDSTTFNDVVALLDAYQLWKRIPSSVRNLIRSGIEGTIPETPKPRDPIFESSYHQVIGTNRDACQAVMTYATREQAIARILTTECQGEAREVGEKLGILAQHLTTQPNTQVLVAGSETTVTVQNEGKGGRNTEIVAAALPYLRGTEGLVIVSLATDGIDGPTDAAGAIADGQSLQRANALNLSSAHHLDAHETYRLFHALDDLLITGPTRTNVRDVTIIVWIGALAEE
jgi:glycerate-2-kinase